MLLKDKRIKILRNQAANGETDSHGFPLPDAWIPIHEGELWAYYRQLSGKEISASAIEGIQTENALFIVNWRDDLTTGMIIKFKNKYYDITRIDDYQGYKTALSLYCTHNTAQHYTDQAEQIAEAVASYLEGLDGEAVEINAGGAEIAEGNGNNPQIAKAVEDYFKGGNINISGGNADIDDINDMLDGGTNA